MQKNAEKKIEGDFISSEIIGSEEIKSRFLEHGIPYDAIDPEMRELIYLLNFRLGLKTQFCCIGHDTDVKFEKGHVIFDNSVTDNDMKAFVKKLSECIFDIDANATYYEPETAVFHPIDDLIENPELQKTCEKCIDLRTLNNNIKFEIWVRMGPWNTVLSNWMIKFPISCQYLHPEFEEQKKAVLSKLCECLRGN